MIRLDWMSLWDQLRGKLGERTTWGRTQILDLMNELERDMVRKRELEDQFDNSTDDNLVFRG